MDLALIAGALYFGGKIMDQKTQTVESVQHEEQENTHKEEEIQPIQEPDEGLMITCAPKSNIPRKRKMSFYETRPDAFSWGTSVSDQCLAPVEFGKRERDRMRSTLNNRVATQNESFIDTPLPEEAFRIKPKCSEQLYGNSAKTAEEYGRFVNGHVVEIKRPEIATPLFKAPRINQDLSHLTTKVSPKVGGGVLRNTVDTSELARKLLYHVEGKSTGNKHVQSSNGGQTTRTEREMIYNDMSNRSRPQSHYHAMTDYSGIYENPPTQPEELDNYTTSWTAHDQRQRQALGEVVKIAEKDKGMKARYGKTQGRQRFTGHKLVQKQSIPTTRKESLVQSIMGKIQHLAKPSTLIKTQLRDTKKDDTHQTRTGIKTQGITAGTIDNPRRLPLKKTRRDHKAQDTSKHCGTPVSQTVSRIGTHSSKSREVRNRPSTFLGSNLYSGGTFENLKKASKNEKQARPMLPAAHMTVKRHSNRN